MGKSVIRAVANGAPRNKNGHQSNFQIPRKSTGAHAYHWGRKIPQAELVHKTPNGEQNLPMRATAPPRIPVPLAHDQPVPGYLEREPRKETKAMTEAWELHAQGKYCGNQLCCWGPAGKRAPRSCRCRWCNMPKPVNHKPKDGECPVKMRHKFTRSANA